MVSQRPAETVEEFRRVSDTLIQATTGYSEFYGAFDVAPVRQLREQSIDIAKLVAEAKWSQGWEDSLIRAAATLDHSITVSGQRYGHAHELATQWWASILMLIWRHVDFPTYDRLYTDLAFEREPTPPHKQAELYLTNDPLLRFSEMQRISPNEYGLQGLEEAFSRNAELHIDYTLLSLQLTREQAEAITLHEPTADGYVSKEELDQVLGKFVDFKTVQNKLKPVADRSGSRKRSLFLYSKIRAVYLTYDSTLEEILPLTYSQFCAFRERGK